MQNSLWKSVIGYGILFMREIIRFKGDKLEKIRGMEVAVMDTAGKLEYYTIEDIYHLPDGQRAELIDGGLYMLAAPGRVHQEIVHFLDRIIGNYVQEQGGGCKVYPSPFAVFLNASHEIYVEPDISVICDKNKLTEEGCEGAPDWIVEVVSPSSRSMDYNKKLLKYGTAGVREYWIVDPMKQRIMVYNFEQGTVEEYTFSDRVKAGIYEGLVIDFAQIELG